MPDRLVESANQLLTCAKLTNSSTFKSRGVHFQPNLDSDQTAYNLFQLTEQAIVDLLDPSSDPSQQDVFLHLGITQEEESKLTGNVSAIDIDQQRSYALNETETSNSLLLVADQLTGSHGNNNENEMPNLKLEPLPVLAVKRTYYQLADRIAPSLRAVNSLLKSSSIYYGPLEEDVGEKRERFTFAQLTNRFHCSDLEMAYALIKLRACEVDGYIRLMDVEYLTQFIRDAFACADEFGWNWREIGFPLNALVKHMSAANHDSPVVLSVLNLFFAKRPTNPRLSSSTETHIFPRNTPICQLFAEHLLLVTYGGFELKDFLRVWQECLPGGDGLRPMLRRHLTCSGQAYLLQSSGSGSDDHQTGKQGIVLLRLQDLPDSPLESRLASLFSRRSCWPERELAGYFGDLKPPPRGIKNPNGLLAIPDESSPLIDKDCDFDYADLATGNNKGVNSDQPSSRSVESVISSFLMRNCRLVTGKSGRYFTNKAK